MISEIMLKFGSAPGCAATPIRVSGVTVFVGPNNSGKSKVLGEIHEFCTSGHVNVASQLLQSVTFATMTADQAKAELSNVITQPLPSETIQANQIFVARRGNRIRVDRNRMLSALQNPGGDLPIFANWFLQYLTLKLDGPGRVGLVNQQAAGDFQRDPQTTLQVLFRNNTKREKVRRTVHGAIGSYLVIDPTNLGQLRLRLSAREPTNDMEERNIHEAGVAFHAEATPIEQASDGVKAFAGIIVELEAGDPRVLLIDEPEAFLHPSLSSKLGSEIARSVVQTDKRVFASTHSPSFVMGCIQSGAPVNIVRLTYRNSVATARVLPSNEILELMRNPLLRSTGVLNGLFYEFVIVTESDADRAFYQEINERLLRFKPEWGIPNCLFLNAQGKGSVHTIITPLRKLGIPTAAIYDIDILKCGGTEWTNIMDSTYVPDMSRPALATLRSNIKTAMDATGRDMKREGGASILTDGDREAAESFFRQLAEYGVFTVERGELEVWLKHLGATGHGPSWLINMFTAMGEDPDAQKYVRPADDDVWLFMSKIKQWLVDPNRRGIPA